MVCWSTICWFMFNFTWPLQCHTRSHSRRYSFVRPDPSFRSHCLFDCALASRLYCTTTLDNCCRNFALLFWQRSWCICRSLWLAFLIYCLSCNRRIAGESSACINSWFRRWHTSVSRGGSDCNHNYTIWTLNMSVFYLIGGKIKTHGFSAAWYLILEEMGFQNSK